MPLTTFAQTPSLSILAAGPEITTEPLNQIACVGGSATFTVLATGSNLTYQWRKGTLNLMNGGNINGANSNSLVLDPVLATDVALDYNVVVSGTEPPPAYSMNVPLVVFTPPYLVSDPSDNTSAEGSSAEFSVTAIGTGLMYQWRKGNQILSNGGNISGATEATLRINPVGISDASSVYNVLVSGICQPGFTSAYAALYVNVTGIDILNSGSQQSFASLLPNPFTNALQINLKDELTINKPEIRVYNILGTELLNKSIIGRATTLVTTSLSPGIYYYKILSNNKVIQSGKLISRQ